ncbi:MAG: putative lipid II flippase FtsW [Gammaproteobacteria bacterium]|nr:putative lipid II flippase FtsW [Gammaproteobacteria bacterium]
MNAIVHIGLGSNGKAARPAVPLTLGVDYYLIMAVIVLLMLGAVMVASASITMADQQLGEPFYYFKRHILYMGLGVTLAVMAQHIPLAHWQRASSSLMIFGLFLLIIVLIPGIGRSVNGATRWLSLAGVSLQVSEPARLFLLMYLAGYVVRRYAEVAEQVMGLLKPLIVFGIAGIFLLLQPDFGSTVVLLSAGLGMLFLAGANMWRFSGVLFSFVVAFAVLAISSPYRLQRLTTFLNPWADPFNTGFQLSQSLIAIGSGGITGVGLGASVQKLFYLPEAHNDFLFAIIAEELGLLGVLIILILFFVIIWRGVCIAAAAERREQWYGAYLAYGLTLWIGVQAFINMGVNMGMLPTKGLTLPLVSAGGSSLMVMCLAIGLLLRVHKETALQETQALTPSLASARRGDE